MASCLLSCHQISHFFTLERKGTQIHPELNVFKHSGNYIYHLHYHETFVNFVHITFIAFRI
jgi:hypothetical protein